MTKKTKGIVILATGHPIYGGWAANLCMSVKVTDPMAKVALLYRAPAINHINGLTYIFDHLIEIPEEMLRSNGIQSFVKPKVCLYDLTPFDETIFIDADVIMFQTKRVTDLFNELSDEDFVMGSRGIAKESDKFKWTSIDKMKEVYNVDGDIYNLSSEFIYWKKSKTAKRIFDEAKKAFDKPNLDYVRFSNGIPDELAFQIAFIKAKHKPKKDTFLPFYWPHLEEAKKPHLTQPELYKTDKYGYSMGGNTQHTHTMAIYDNIARWCATKFGLSSHFPMRNKRDVLPTRHTI